MNTKLYTGTGSSQSITGVGFQPDWTWIKKRNGGEQHVLFDAIRGVQKYIASNTSSAESTTATTLTAFNSDGFTQGGHGMTGANSGTYASWNWKANGTGSANTAGSINSTVSVNTTAGFSIVKWSGTSATGTVGHGLGSVPKTVWVKSLANAEGIYTYWQPLGNNKQLLMSSTSAQGTTTLWNNTTPTSSVFSVTNHSAVNGSGDYIAYCFADVQGYSKVGGSYTGNGNADGTFVYTGFKPAFIMTKNSGYTGNWVMKDNKRSGTSALQNFGQMNPNQTENPSANLNNAENKSSAFAVDILSNGFKMRGVDNAGSNWDGNNYIYMAFAEAPLVGTNGVTAKAR
jgi:hypothetical protein